MHIDTGNTAFMLLCSSLVMLMTPGLAFFYGGLVGRKNVLAIMIQSFVTMGWTTVLWWAFGFSVCFSGDMKSGTDFFGILGNFHWAFLRGITLDTPSLINSSIPMIVFCAYQMMFAIITPALITGAFANRVTFKAYMLFLTAWLALVYFPSVHMLCGRNRGWWRWFFGRGADEQVEIGRRARRVGRGRCRRLPRYRSLRRVRDDPVQSGRRGWPAARQQAFLSRATWRGAAFFSLGLCLYLRDALDHRSDHCS